MTEPRFTFSAQARLRKRPQFNLVYQMGCKQNTPHFVLLTLEASVSESRLGVTVSRKVGNAVVRNRLKRIIREFFRRNRHRFNRSVDLSVIAKRNAGGLSSATVWSELERLFKD